MAAEATAQEFYAFAGERPEADHPDHDLVEARINLLLEIAASMIKAETGGAFPGVAKGIQLQMVGRAYWNPKNLTSNSFGGATEGFSDRGSWGLYLTYPEQELLSKSKVGGLRFIPLSRGV